jgi:hydrogenase maturation protease
MSWPRPLRVVGVGSPHGDDALAWEVVRQLQQASERGGISAPGEIEYHIVSGGPQLLDLLDGRGTLLLVDALAASPSFPDRIGSIHRLGWPDPRLEVLRPGTTHHLCPAETLQLAAALGVVPPRVVIWAITGAVFDPQTGLSPAVTAAIPDLVQRLAADLEAISVTGSS